MSIQAVCDRCHAVFAIFRSVVMAAGSVALGLPLFLSARPRTPLRVLCIMAFDMLSMLRNARPLPLRRRRLLAALLDFGACANAAFDGKGYCRREFRQTLQLLEEAGIRSSVVQYLRRLRDLESSRPVPAGDDCQFHKVRLYREAVVRLSLGMAAATANGDQRLGEGIRATCGDADLNILFRIVMQCQVIDDVLDYSADRSAGLPSFLTASKSLPRAFALTRLAALGYQHVETRGPARVPVRWSSGYRALRRACPPLSTGCGADDLRCPRTGDLFALRAALSVVSACTKLIIVLGRWAHRTQPDQPFTGLAYGPRLPVADRVDESRPSTAISECSARGRGLAGGCDEESG